MPEEPMKAEEQRDELKALCQKNGLPDLTDELLTQEGARLYIDDLRKQLARRK
jgi:hypothetical protein